MIVVVLAIKCVIGNLSIKAKARLAYFTLEDVLTLVHE